MYSLRVGAAFVTTHVCAAPTSSALSSVLHVVPSQMRYRGVVCVPSAYATRVSFEVVATVAVLAAVETVPERMSVSNCDAVVWYHVETEVVTSTVRLCGSV